MADYATPEEAVRAFALLGTYRRNQELLLEAPTASENGPPDLARGAGADRRRRWPRAASVLDEVEVGEVLAAYGIPVVPHARACRPIRPPPRQRRGASAARWR